MSRRIATLGCLLLATVASAADLAPWTELARMRLPRQEFPAAHLDGRIYIAGGMDSSTCCNALKAFEAYDIATNAWSPLPDLPLGVNHPGLIGLDGRIYVVGGFTTGPKASGRAFVYTVSSRTWRELPAMPVKAAAPGVVAYDGKVWVFGGTAQDSWKGSGGKNVQVYDPATDRWTIVNSAMPYGKQHIGAAVVGTKVYISPGRMPREDATCQEYDLVANTWRVMTPMPELPRTGAVSSWPAIDGRLYYIGGETSSAATRYVHEFTPDASGGTWRRMRDYPTGLHGVGPIAVGNRIYVVGGGTSINVTGRTDRVYTTTIGSSSTGGSIQFQASGASVGESAGTVVLTITRTGTTTSAVSAAWTTVAGSAAAGTDFTAASGTVAFAAGETAKTLAIAILGDTLVEGTETFSVVLSAPSSGASIGSPAQTTVTIADDDTAAQPGTLAFAATALTAGEAAGAVALTVTRSGGSDGSVSVAYATADGTAAAGSDYGATSGTLTFAAGQTSASISVPILQDATSEADESFTVTLASPGGGATLGPAAIATVTIGDDDGTGTGTVLSSTGFESGWEGWVSGGSNAVLSTDPALVVEGAQSAVVSDDLGDRSAFWTDGAIDATGSNVITVSFRMLATDLGSGHRLAVAWWDGSAWREAASLLNGSAFVNGVATDQTVVLDRAALGVPAALRLRFEAFTGRGFRKISIDRIQVMGDGGGTTPPPPPGGDDLLDTDFESGWGAWTSGGGNAVLTTDPLLVPGGLQAAVVSNSLGDASAFWTTGTIDTAGLQQVSIGFQALASDLGTGHRLIVAYWDGTAWQTAASYLNGTDLHNGTVTDHTLILDRSQTAFPDALRVRFEAQCGDRNLRKVGIDGIRIAAPAPAGAG